MWFGQINALWTDYHVEEVFIGASVCSCVIFFIFFLIVSGLGCIRIISLTLSCLSAFRGCHQ